ncbi:MAG: RNA-binding protein [Stappiaceae bacterium]
MVPPRSETVDRQCALTRDVKPINELIRFVRAPDGSVVPDLKQNLPGRGVWITATSQAVREAQKRRVFARGFKEQVSTEPDLTGLVDTLLEKSALGSLSLARKAGLVVTGFAKVTSAIRNETAGGVIHASDASEDGLRKVFGAITATYGRVDGFPVIRTFASAQLNVALGGTNVVNAALLAGRASDGFIARERALARFRGEFGISTSDGANGAVAQD